MSTVRKIHSKKEYVYESVRENILSGEMPPGARLVIDEIAQRLGASAIPVREALQRLQAEGLVEIEPYVGARVTEIHADLIHEIFGLLEATEVLSGRAACLQMSEDDFAQIERLLAEMDAALDDGEAWSRLNMTLHHFICQQTRMALVQRTLLRVQDHWNRLRRCFLEEVSAQRMAQAQAEHWQILAALRTRQPDAVEEVIRRHNREALADYLTYLRQQGHLSPRREA